MNEQQELLFKLWNLINSPMKHGHKWSTFTSESVVEGVANLKKLMLLNGISFGKEKE